MACRVGGAYLESSPQVVVEFAIIRKVKNVFVCRVARLSFSARLPFAADLLSCHAVKVAHVSGACCQPDPDKLL